MKKHKIIIIVLSCIVVIESAFLIYFIARRPGKPAYPPAVAIKGRIAIVIDDWGYNLNNMYLLDGLKQRITASILPNLPHSANAAKELRRRGVEVILHLPMEPKEKFRLEKNTVMSGMSASRIKDILSEDLASVKFARGVSNHMGSKATEDARVMEAIFKELKRKRLYFLDSFVSGNSACGALARKLGVSFARRDVFLDNQENAEYIRQQVSRLKSRARAGGAAIGIGHDRKITLQVLKEEIPRSEKEGYKFVFVSELLR